jgi:hypothetical protein
VYDNWAQKVAIQIAAEYKMTESEEHIVPEIIQAIEETVECLSQYHSGSRTVLKSQTYLSRNDRTVCFECKAKVKRYMENKKTKEQIEKDRIDRTLAKKAQQEARNNAVEEYVPPVLEILPVESLPQWRVTVVEPTVHYIYAKDFLDAASQVSGNGEIIRIEKV